MQFFQTMIVSILQYGCTTWTPSKQMEKKIDGNCTKMLRALLKKSWKQHPTKQQLYSHQPPISKTIQIKRTGHAGNCWRSKSELISYILQWSPSHGRAGVGCLARAFSTTALNRCSLDDQPNAMDDRDEWRGRVRESVLVARHDDDDDICR